MAHGFVPLSVPQLWRVVYIRKVAFRWGCPQAAHPAASLGRPPIRTGPTPPPGPSSQYHGHVPGVPGRPTRPPGRHRETWARADKRMTTRQDVCERDPPWSLHTNCRSNNNRPKRCTLDFLLTAPGDRRAWGLHDDGGVPHQLRGQAHGRALWPYVFPLLSPNHRGVPLSSNHLLPISRPSLAHSSNSLRYLAIAWLWSLQSGKSELLGSWGFSSW